MKTNKCSCRAGKKRIAGIVVLLLAGSVLLEGCGWEQIRQVGREIAEYLPFLETEDESLTAESIPADKEATEGGADEEDTSLQFSLFDVIKGEKYQDNLPQTESLFRNPFRTGYYYTCLNEEEAAIYDALLAITDDPTSTEYRKGIKTSQDPQSDVFTDEVSRAYQAMIFDHPERFWFRKESGIFGYYYPAVPNWNGEYTVEFRLTEIYTDYVTEMNRFNEAVDLFFADIDLTQSQPVLALQIHDKLVDMVTYDGSLADTFLGNGSGFDYGYTAYGALVENSRGEAHTAVCDGYSYAYEYLLQQAGIMATRVGGRAGDSVETAYPHSWNLVCLDGAWYETDVTWDDREVSVDPGDPAYDLYMEAMQDPYYWGKIRHHLFQLTTSEMAYFEPDDSYTYYTANGYASFLGTSVHIRDTAENHEEKDVLSWLAPYAEGTTYTYDFYYE